MKRKRDSDETDTAAALPGRNALSSEAYRWLSGHYARIRRSNKGSRIPWQKLAQTAGELGLKDRNGNPPTAETLRKNFYRIGKRKAVEAELAAKKAGSRKPVANSGPPPIARPPQRESWRPHPRVDTGSSPHGSAKEHPLMKRLRERSGG